MKKKILIAFGTRPEAIKMCPLIKELEGRAQIDVKVVFTGQHHMAREVMEVFGVIPDYDMNIMRPSQSLFDITENILSGIRDILCREAPWAVVVHGDTSTAFTVALAAFYADIPVYHVEAGLRSHDARLPFPEEFNRRAVSLVASKHFAPTARAAENLIHEGVRASDVYVTGNTVIDAMRYTLKEDYRVTDGERLIFLTAHRRESIGKPLEEMLLAVREIADGYEDVRVMYPVHPNPRIGKIARDILGDCKRVTLCSPLGVVECHNVMSRSYILLTDSGGIQEEGAALGVPVLVMRDVTERPEGILAGVSRLAGTDRCQIVATVRDILDHKDAHDRMSAAKNPYGDGNACKIISDIIAS